MKGESNAFLIYQDDNGVSNVNVRFEGEDVWLTAEQLQQLFQASQQDVSHHIQQIYADGELLAEATNKKGPSFKSVDSPFRPVVKVVALIAA